MRVTKRETFERERDSREIERECTWVGGWMCVDVRGCVWMCVDVCEYA